MLKNKSCQNCVLTIPLCRGGRDEATGEKDIKIGPRTWPHAPSRSGESSAHARRRSARVFFARMGWPDPNTRWPTRIMMTSSSRKHDAIMHSWHAMSASSQLTRQHSGTHLPRNQPRAELRRAKLSWAEGEDSVQRSLRATGSEIESRPLIRPELFWSNLSHLKCDLDDFRLVSS